MKTWWQMLFSVSNTRGCTQGHPKNGSRNPMIMASYTFDRKIAFGRSEDCKAHLVITRLVKSYCKGENTKEWAHEYVNFNKCQDALFYPVYRIKEQQGVVWGRNINIRSITSIGIFALVEIISTLIHFSSLICLTKGMVKIEQHQIV